MTAVQVPAQIAAMVSSARLPENYQAAKQAIAECEHLDQCAEWADKAAALASYARQADDLELETHARRIRLRAVRRCGELLRACDARGGDRRAKVVTPLEFARRSRAAVAQQAGLSKHKTRAAVNIAAIPEAEFTAAVESNRPPGTTLLALWNKQRPPERVRSVTQRSLAEVFKSVAAGRALEGLLGFERNAAECGVETIVEILRGRARQLQRVQRGIALAFRLNTALEEAGRRGNPMLRRK